MKKPLLLVSVLIMAALPFGCEKQRQQQAFERNLESAVQAAITTNNPSIQISSLTPFSWSKMYSFHPYTSSKDIDSQLGFKWNSSLKKEIESGEGFTLLVFVKDGEVIQEAMIRRNLCDWELGGRNGFTTNEATFDLKKTTPAEIVLTIKTISSEAR